MRFNHGRLEVTRHCLPDLSDMSSLSDLLLQPSVIRRVTRLRGICLKSVLSANLCASRGGSRYVQEICHLQGRSLGGLKIFLLFSFVLHVNQAEGLFCIKS
ncbi:unnamed protein product [Camellia sinensis]